MKVKTITIAALLVLASTAPAAVAATATGSTAETKAYSGAHVTFETANNAVVDYQVDGTTVIQNVSVQSASKADTESDAGLAGLVSLSGAGLSVSARVDTHATVTTESGATINAHDNENGVLVVTSSSGAQVVHANVSASSQAEQKSESRVVVHDDDDGTAGTFIVIGDGEITVDAEGNVAAKIDGNSRLVYRQYENGRSEAEKTHERLIANGTATAEVYYQQTSESGEDGTQRAVDVINYSSQTTVEVTSKTKSRLNMTVQRSKNQGKVLITHVSESAMSSAEDVQVYVDGDAAAQVQSYSEVVAATEGGSQSAYMVRQSGSAEAATDVVVGINHFSKKEVSVQSTDGGSGGSDDTQQDGGDGTTDGSGPGFGVVAAVAALGAALIAARRL